MDTWMEANTNNYPDPNGMCSVEGTQRVETDINGTDGTKMYGATAAINTEEAAGNHGQATNQKAQDALDTVVLGAFTNIEIAKDYVPDTLNTQL